MADRVDAANPDRSFLELFPIPDRNPIAQYFHFRVREGAATPRSVVLRVAAHVGARLTQAWGDTGEQRRQQSYLCGLADHFDLALLFAEHVLHWEALPQAERDAQKAERGRTYQREYMATQSATAKQVAYLARLGWDGAVPESRAAASDLIDQLLAEGRR